MNLYFSIEYDNQDGYRVHSDECSKTIDRKFCHSLLDEYLDNLTLQKTDGGSGLQFSICESHIEKKDNIQECDY